MCRRCGDLRSFSAQQTDCLVVSCGQVPLQPSLANCSTVRRTVQSNLDDESIPPALKGSYREMILAGHANDDGMCGRMTSCTRI